jgi:hypothetical protein
VTDDDRARRNVRRGIWFAVVTGGIAVVLFIAAILLESGKAAGVGAVLISVAIVVAAATGSYADYRGL